MSNSSQEADVSKVSLEFDKCLIQLLVGVLVLSMALDRFVDLDRSGFGFLILSWVLFGSSLGMLFGTYILFFIKSFRDRLTKILNTGAPCAFFMGICCLIAFVAVNPRKKENRKMDSFMEDHMVQMRDEVRQNSSMINSLQQDIASNLGIFVVNDGFDGEEITIKNGIVQILLKKNGQENLNVHLKQSAATCVSIEGEYVTIRDTGGLVGNYKFNNQKDAKVFYGDLLHSLNW